MSASFCKPPRPALISTGAPIGLLRLSFANRPRLRMCRVSGVSGSRQTRISVCRRNASSCAFAVEAIDAARSASGSGSSPKRESRAACSTSAALAAKRAEPHDADRDRARRPLRFRRPALLALAFPQIELLPVVHQHVQHDIFRHALGEVGDRDAHQRHVGQRAVRHQRIDAGAEIEDDAQIWKCGEFARLRLPDRGIMDLGRIERRVRQQQDPPVAADVVEPALPSLPATSFRSRHAPARASAPFIAISLHFALRVTWITYGLNRFFSLLSSNKGDFRCAN